MRTLTFIGAVLLVLAGVLLMMTPLHAQPSSGPPAAIPDARTMHFDVVSIKRDKANQLGPAIVHSPPESDTMRIVNMSPHLIVGTAYGLPLHDQVVGLPGWADSETYDIEAKISAENAPEFHKLLPMQRNPMLQAVLADRFHMVCHFETRTLPAYALVIAKSGPKLTEVEPGTLPNGLKDPGGISADRSTIAATIAPISLLLVVLQQRLGRPVVDHTGLTGRYTFKLSWTPDSASAPNASDAAQGPSIFTAIQEQLGLKLGGTHAPLHVLVVDHIERPTEN